MIRLLAACLLFLCATAARADDTFFRVPLQSLTITDGTLPRPDENSMRRWQMRDVMRPYAVLDGPGEVYAMTPQELAANTQAQFSATSSDPELFIRTPDAQRPIVGSLFLPNPDWSALVALRFTIPAPAASPDARLDFYRAKESHYTLLLNRDIPGAAWFRHQANQARGILLKDNPDLAAQRPQRPTPDQTSTYDLFVGGRAVSENLQLARDLPPAPAQPGQSKPAEQPIAASSIEGITVASFDWTPLLPKTKPALDPLAAAIPADQHAVFFPSFEALMALSDETSEAGLPIFRGIGQRSEDGRLVERYQRQLCLQPGVISRLLGPQAIKSIAITGSDPYFPLGTDVAVLFQGAEAAGLRELLATQIRLSAAATPAATAKSGEIDGIPYSAFISDDRAVCSYLCVIGPAVVVTNSPIQIQNLAAVQTGKSPAIATLPEYHFFRDRYPLAAENQTGLVFLSDATIRRWCSAPWRIAASRRVRAAAVLADLNAAHMLSLIAGSSEPARIEPDATMPTIGQITLTGAGPRSSVYGSLSFMTPIAELAITDVTPDEAASYKRWRDSYQRNWSWAFDPIAASFSIQKSRLALDLTVMPLIVGSQYRTWINAAQGAAIAPDAGDPHDAIAHGVLALNINSPAMKNAAGMALMFAPGFEVDPLGWLGQSVALYADPDPFWKEMLAARDDDGRFLERNISRLPVALHAEVNSALKLTAFIAAARGALEQSAPGMAAWETRTHNGQPYVRVGLSEKAKAESRNADGFDSVSLHYAATPRALILSLNEEVLKRAIDRQTARTAKPDAKPDAQPDAKPDTKPDPNQEPFWLGSSMCLRVTREGLNLLNGPGGNFLRENTQRRAWSNIPILNEWKRRFPDKDPIQVHQTFWSTRLICPGGGQYAWNDTFKTMESTIYGHPGEPKPGPESGPLDPINSANFGLTFENHGLRARTVIDRDAGKE